MATMSAVSVKRKSARSMTSIATTHVRSHSSTASASVRTRNLSSNQSKCILQSRRPILARIFNIGRSILARDGASSRQIALGQIGAKVGFSPLIFPCRKPEIKKRGCYANHKNSVKPAEGKLRCGVQTCREIIGRKKIGEHFQLKH